MSVPEPPVGAASASNRLTPPVEPSRLLEGLPAEHFTLDAQGRIVEHQSGSSVEAGKSEHLLGRTLREWCRGRGYPDHVGEGRQAAVERCLEARRPVSFEEIWHSPLGGTRHSIQSYAPLIGPDGPEAVIALSLAVPREGRARGSGSGRGGQGSPDEDAVVLRAARAQADRKRESIEARRRTTRAPRVGGLSDEFLMGLPGLAEVRARVKSLASWTGPVLVTGEVGSGTCVVARALHGRGAEGTGLFQELDCLDQPDEVDEALRRLTASLLDQERLPGHPSTERVRYTGLTLHGPATLPESAQRTLAEAIGTLTAADRGIHESERSLRLVVTTAADLPSQAADRRFRSDLVEALSGARVDVPPLRHRSADLPLLAGRLLERASRRLGRSVEPLTPADLGRLSAYLWPGNVPELATVVERAVLTARDGRPTVALPEGCAANDAAERGALGVPVFTESEMQQRERDNLLEALRRTSWKIYGPGGAAELLGLAPTTLTSRIKKLGLARP